MLSWILWIVIVAAAAVLGLAATKPKTFRVAREAQIGAPPEKVLALINDFHEWPKWSPWEKMDPAMNKTLTGPASGVGSTYAWRGNKKVGQGRMEITGVSASRVDIDLEFMAPWKARNKTVFSLTPKNGGTAVTWAMTGSAPFMFRVMSVFANMDQMIGKDFEAGLAAMKQVAESPLLTTR